MLPQFPQFVHDFVNGSTEYPGQLNPDDTAAIIQFMDRHWFTVQVSTGWGPLMIWRSYPRSPYLAFWAAAFITYWDLKDSYNL